MYIMLFFLILQIDESGDVLATIFSVEPDNYYCGVYLHSSENCYKNLKFLQVCLGTQVCMI